MRRAHEAVVHFVRPQRRARDVRQHRAAQGLLRACASSSRWRRMLAGASAWVTGLRREQSGTRGDGAASPRRDGQRPHQVQPAGRLELGRRLALHRRCTTCPTTRCTTSSSPASAARPARAPSRVGEDFRAGRWWWEDEAAKECGLHVDKPRRRSRRMNAPLTHRQTAARARPQPPRLARGRGHLHPARGGGLRSSARRCCSPAARTPASCCAWPRRPSSSACAAIEFEGRLPFPLLHVDTGHNFPEVIAFRDRRVAEMGERLVVGHLDDSIARGTVRLAHPLESRNGHQTVALLEAIEEHRFDVPDRRRAARRGKGPRQGAHLQPPRRLRPVAAQGAAARAVDAVQHPHPPGRALPQLPDQQLDRARRLALHRAREHPAAGPVLRAPARGDPAQGPAGAGDRRHAGAAGRDRRDGAGALSHRRRHDLHLPGRERRRQRRRDRRRDATVTVSERGATRMDDRTSDASMERRKKEGYF